MRAAVAISRRGWRCRRSIGLQRRAGFCGCPLARIRGRVIPKFLLCRKRQRSPLAVELVTAGTIAGCVHGLERCRIHDARRIGNDDRSRNVNQPIQANCEFASLIVIVPASTSQTARRPQKTYSSSHKRTQDESCMAFSRLFLFETLAFARPCGYLDETDQRIRARTS